MFLASCLGLAEALTNSGAGELLGHGVAWILGDVRSPMVVFAALTFLALFISQFITNSTAIIIVASDCIVSLHPIWISVYAVLCRHYPGGEHRLLHSVGGRSDHDDPDCRL